MIVSRLLLHDQALDSVLGSLQNDARFIVTGPRVDTQRDLERSVASGFFGPMADHLQSDDDRILVMPTWPDTLPLAFRRMLARTALALGAVPLGGAGPAELFGRPVPAWLQLVRRLEPVGWSRGGPNRVRGWDQPLPVGSSWYELVRRLEPNRGPGAGCYAPGRILLVGERPGVAKTGELKHRLPFVTFTYDGCAAWFAEQLEAKRIYERELYWINAYDSRGELTSGEFVRDLAPLEIWALGAYATSWCQAYGLKHKSLPHPQYWKRFHYNEPYPFP